jgi:hypothetical protein
LRGPAGSAFVGLHGGLEQVVPLARCAGDGSSAAIASGVGHVLLEGDLRRREGLLPVAQLGVEHLRRAHHERHRLGDVAVLGQLVVPRHVERRQVVPARGLAVQRLQRREGPPVQRVGLQHRLVRGARPVRLADALLPDVRRLQVQRDLRLRVLRHRGLTPSTSTTSRHSSRAVWITSSADSDAASVGSTSSALRHASTASSPLPRTVQ